ncbi:MAG: helix-turn-helix domain-containing protein [Actinomycetota bacterium]|nr:helix-turn-helix domain-containing protein [Actinomycetota bacterium]
MAPSNESPIEKIIWLSSKEACEYLGVSLQTLYRFVDSGSLPAHHMGRVIRFKYKDLIAFVEAQRVVPGTLSSVTRHTDPEK